MSDVTAATNPNQKRDEHLLVAQWEINAIAMHLANIDFDRDQPIACFVVKALAFRLQALSEAAMAAVIGEIEAEKLRSVIDFHKEKD